MDKFLEDIFAKHAAQAVEAVQKETHKKLKPIERPPENRLTLDQVIATYDKSGIKPSRAIYWFYPDRQTHPMIQRSYLDEETRSTGTPIGAMAQIRYQEILKETPDQIVAMLFKAPTHKWVLGPIGQILGYTTSYVAGFNVGFDSHPPGHRLCSYHFHCGYADGKTISALLVAKGLMAPKASEDPWYQEDDPDVLDELIRTQSYWRDEWGPKPKFLTDVRDLTTE